MKKIHLLVLFFLLFRFASTQTTFDKAISTSGTNNTGVDFVHAPGGGYYVVYQHFTTNSTMGSGLLRLDAGGQVMRHYRFVTEPQEPFFCFFNSLDWTPDGHLLITDVHFRILKMDTLGNIIWAKKLPPATDLLQEINAIGIHPQGQFGVALQETHNETRFLSCTASGDIVTYRYSNAYPVAKDVDPSPDGGYLVTGEAAVLSKLSSTGNAEWTSSKLSPGNTALSFSASVIHADSSISTVGTIGGPAIPNTRMIAARFLPDGTLSWMKRYDSQVSMNGAEVAEFGNGLIIAGCGIQGPLLVHTDMSGIPVWASAAPGSTMNVLSKMQPGATGITLLGRQGNTPHISAKFIQTDQWGRNNCTLDTATVSYSDITDVVFGFSSHNVHEVGDSFSTAAFLQIAPLSTLSDACLPTSTEEEQDLQADGFLVYPNPGRGPLSILGQWRDGKPTRYLVFDVQGKKLAELNAPGGDHNVTIRVPGNGVYLLRAEHGDKVICRKVIRY